MAQQAGGLRWHSARASIAAPRRGERLDRRAPWRPSRCRSARRQAHPGLDRDRARDRNSDREQVAKVSGRNQQARQAWGAQPRPEQIILSGLPLPNIRRNRLMKNLLQIVVIAVALGASPVAAQAKGCIKGAIVGAVAGHYVGHTKTGALAGCIIGHSRTAKRQRMQQGQVNRSQL
jgi:hypothetical protein